MAPTSEAKNQMAAIASGRPQAHFCCISHEIMVDPVVDREGNTYERSAIMRWLNEGNRTSPLTRNVLDPSHLTPNRALKDAIESFVAQPGEQAMPVVSASPTRAPNDTTSMVHEKKDNIHCITIEPPDGQVPGVDISLVIDCSGSMSIGVKAAGSNESDGLDRLDICKHAAKTIVNGCRACDRVSLVQFSANASVSSELTQMDAAGKGQLKVAIAALTTSGSTNIWDALKRGLDTFPNQSDRPGVLMLLTDGCPNILPPRGHVQMLEKYFDKRSGLNVSIHTFGFGHDLDSELLRDIAVSTQGTFSFIPDAGLVGTTFIHDLANVRTTLAHKVTLSLETDGDVCVLGLDPSNYTKTSWGYEITIGPLSYGQARRVVFDCNRPVQTSMRYNTKSLTCEPHELLWSESLPSFERQLLVDTIAKCSELCKANNYTGALALVDSALEVMINPELKKDLDGEVRLSCSDHGAYTKWGRHYQLSLSLAHWRQQCNNFKDHGLQMLGGEEFNKVRDELDDIFDNMPAPKPSHRPTYSAGRQSGPRGFTFRSAGVAGAASAGAASAPSPLRMVSYRDSSAPCFSGHSLVHMHDGSKKRVDNIRMGDVVETDSGHCAVRCVVKTNCADNSARLVSLSPDLHLTEWHPVRTDGEWKFPGDIDLAFDSVCDAVYSFLLEPGHTAMIIGGVECIVLGHEILDDPVATHPFFGSRTKIIECLRTLHGAADGYIVLEGGRCVERDTETNFVCNLYQ